jgi:hypothetical protein
MEGRKQVNTQTNERWAVVRPQNKGEFYLKWQGHSWSGLVAVQSRGRWWYKDDGFVHLSTDDMDEWWGMMEIVRAFHVRPSSDARMNEYLVIAEMPFPHEHLVLAHNFSTQDEAIRFLDDMYASTTCVWDAEIFVGSSTLMEWRVERGLI